jgi:hypothetical protein
MTTRATANPNTLKKVLKKLRTAALNNESDSIAFSIFPLLYLE